MAESLSSAARSRGEHPKTVSNAWRRICYKADFGTPEGLPDTNPSRTQHGLDFSQLFFQQLLVIEFGVITVTRY